MVPVKNLPVPKRPRDNLIVFILILTVATILAMVRRLTSKDVTVMTAAVVGLLAAWTLPAVALSLRLGLVSSAVRVIIHY